MTDSQNLCGLIFEEASKCQADMLVAFENSIIETKLYGKPLDFIGATREICNNKFYFLKNKKEIVGTAAYCLREDGSCYMSNIAVLPNYRGQRIGRAAVNFLIEKCINAWRIELVTHPENFRAISLYKSVGFRVESRIENYYGDGEPRLLMVRLGTVNRKE